MLERPGMFGTADWRLLRGPDGARRSKTTRSSGAIGAWLELVQWWQWAFAACVEPPDLHRAHLCLKLVAEPARIWLWLAHGERPESRGDVLERALALMPDEEDALRAALDLRAALPRSPVPPLRETLPSPRPPDGAGRLRDGGPGGGGGRDRGAPVQLRPAAAAPAVAAGSGAGGRRSTGGAAALRLACARAPGVT